MHCLTVQWKASYAPQHFPQFFSLGLRFEDFVVVCFLLKRQWGTFAALNDSNLEMLETCLHVYIFLNGNATSTMRFNTGPGATQAA